MNKKMKVTFGTLSTLAVVATPTIAVVSCGNQEQKKQKIITHEIVNPDKRDYPHQVFKILKNQNPSTSNFRDIIMNSKGLRDADDVNEATLANHKGYISLDITYSDALKERAVKLIENYKKKYKEVEISGEMISLFNNMYTSKFFETLTDKENAKKWAKKLNKLYKEKKFYLSFNLILPKEFNGYNLGISIINQGIIKLRTIKNNSNIKINGIRLGDSTPSFKMDKLPKELKFLYIFGGDGFSFNDNYIDFKKIPKNLKYFYFYADGITKSKTQEIQNYIQKQNFDKNIDSTTNPNTIDNPKEQIID